MVYFLIFGGALVAWGGLSLLTSRDGSRATSWASVQRRVGRVAVPVGIFFLFVALVLALA